MDLLMLREPWFWILVISMAGGFYFLFFNINNRALRIACFCSLMWTLLLAAAVVLNLTLGTG